MKKRKKIIKIDYELMKRFLERENLFVHESDYLGDGILGRFFPPNIILINPTFCDKCDPKYFGEQKRVLVLLHEMCHWTKWLEHKDNPIQTDEEACFNFEEVVCRGVLNEEGKLRDYKMTIENNGIKKACMLLMEATRICKEAAPYMEAKYSCCCRCKHFYIGEEDDGMEYCHCEIHGYDSRKENFSEYSEICDEYEWEKQL